MLHRLNKNNKINNKGMTLLEIMIVLGIIGAVMSILLPMVMSRLNASRIKQTKLAIGQMVQSINNFQMDCGKLPANLEFLTKPDPECSNWGPDPYMKKIAKDAWGQEFTYEVSGTNFVIKSPGYKGKEINSEELQ